LNSSSPSSIVVGNGSSLPITSVVDSVLPGPFYLNNILLAPDIVQSLLSLRCFTTDNWLSMEFDPFGLPVKNLTTRNVIVRSNSTSLLYTIRLFGSVTPSSGTAVALTAVTPATWHRRLGHPGLTFYLACLGHLLLIVPATNMICVMRASWENTSGCPFLVH
jgi:hypothetical protein